jgi:hypothetical protein
MVKRILESAQRLLKQEPLQKPFLHHWIPRKESNQLVLIKSRNNSERYKSHSNYFLEYKKNDFMHYIF